MTTKEHPVVEEFPVRRPATVQENAFFFYGRNRDYLRGTSTDLAADIPVPPTTAMNRFMVWGGLGAFAALVVSIANPWALVVPGAIVVALVLIGPRVLRRNRAYVAERVAREGHFLSGALLKCAAVGSDHYTGLLIEAVFEFVSPTGDTLVGTIRQPRPDLSGVQLPVPGTPVYILFFIDKEYYVL